MWKKENQVMERAFPPPQFLFGLGIFHPLGSRSITLLGQCKVSEPEIPVTMQQKSYPGVSEGELDSVCQKYTDNMGLPSWKRWI